MNRCTIFSAAPEDCHWIDRLKEKGYVIAADGGYHLALRHNIVPDLVVGDFDSSQSPANLPVVTFNSEKDDTDTGIAIQYGLQKGCAEFLLFGCTGGYLDHTIANISQLAALTNRGASGWMVDEVNAVTVIKPGMLTFSCDVGQRFSVFPWGGPCTVTYERVKYPLHSHTLEKTFPLGVSNEATQSEVSICVEKGMALVVVSDFTNTFFESVYNGV